MNQNEDYEFVSAAMDDDGLSDEMLDKLLSDDEARQKWYEYHMIRDCMQRGRKVVRSEKQFIEIEKERFSVEERAPAGFTAVKQSGTPLQSAAVSEQRKASNSVFGTFAVAASVMAVAVGVWQFYPAGGGTEKTAGQTVQDGDKKAAGIVPVDGGSKQADTDAVSRAEAQGAVVPNAARANQAAPVESKAVRVEKIEQEHTAGEAK